MTVAGQADGQPVYWTYQMTREEMETVTKSVVDKFVNALREALIEVSVL